MVGQRVQFRQLSQGDNLPVKHAHLVFRSKACTSGHVQAWGGQKHLFSDCSAGLVATDGLAWAIVEGLPVGETFQALLKALLSLLNCRRLRWMCPCMHICSG